jgi:hypothetical protein
MIKLAAALFTACVAIADPSYSASFDCHPIGSDKCREAVICSSAAIVRELHEFLRTNDVPRGSRWRSKGQ